MGKPPLTVQRGPMLARQYRAYVRSGVWRCPRGGAHRWVHVGAGQWLCTRCGGTRVFGDTEQAYNDNAGEVAVFGVQGVFDGGLRAVV